MNNITTPFVILFVLVGLGVGYFWGKSATIDVIDQYEETACETVESTDESSLAPSDTWEQRQEFPRDILGVDDAGVYPAGEYDAWASRMALASGEYMYFDFYGEEIAHAIVSLDVLEGSAKVVVSNIDRETDDIIMNVSDEDRMATISIDDINHEDGDIVTVVMWSTSPGTVLDYDVSFE